MQAGRPLQEVGNLLLFVRPFQAADHPATGETQLGYGSKTKAAAGCFLATILILATGCSHLSVKHLAMRPWHLNTSEEVALKFWRFDYRTEARRNGFAIIGKASPVADAVPHWADSVQELWLAAYVSDAKGRVVARDLLVFDPGPLPPDEGLPFLFELQPDKVQSGPLFVTFGYRMVLSGPPAQPGGPDRVFFASESALTRY